MQSGQFIPEIYLKDSHLWSEADKKNANEFKILKEDLENEFRILLGIQTLKPIIPDRVKDLQQQ